MIFEYLKKQRELSEKKKLIKLMVLGLEIPEQQKALYVQALDIVDENCVNQVYDNLTNFSKNLEIKELQDINKNNFVEVAGMRKKEAIEKQQEMNAFSFLINNL